MKNDGGPAFPIRFRYEKSDGSIVTHEADGMSLRQWYAGMALQGLLAESAHPQSAGSWKQAGSFAANAFELADAMIAAEKETT